MTFYDAHQTSLSSVYMQPTVTSYVDNITVTCDVIELPSNSRRNVARPKSAWHRRDCGSDILPHGLVGLLKINLETCVRNVELDDDNQTTRTDQRMKRKHTGSSSTPDYVPASSSSSSLFVDEPTHNRKPEAENGMSQILTARQRVLERYEHKKHLEEHKRHLQTVVDDTSAFRRERSVVTGAHNRASNNGQVKRYGRYRVLDPILRTSSNEVTAAETSIDLLQKRMWRRRRMLLSVYWAK